MTSELKRVAGAGYVVVYDGGRLADVMIAGQVVECVQVRDYDWQSGTLGKFPTNDEIRQQVQAHLDEAGGIDLYRENMP